MDASTHVLVGYASAHGSTAGVADRIAARINSFGCEVDCRPVGPDLDPAAYDAILLGSAVHDMAWLPSAVDFLTRLSGAEPTWFFSVGGLEPRGPVTRRMTRLEIARVEQQFPARFRGRDHRMFAGVVQTAGLALWGRVFWRLVGGRNGDHRDWPAIDRWASDVGAELARLRDAAELRHP
ncbi:menaquinone-dependent protoporphyrinogen oxidase [Blastococcus aggregatus]|uniref:Menaquinone-dependent protoporphyrinogen oxidase n=1 Tax=Blastococcus aggregatus TaxID=38502 RepID=A0A285VAT6_9ACTN|nr:flavodoxin domain-containing protein [Blastococcus aggregatus]SOC49601.1 menaquinone-dependent protoporphyrinogen oxidase [Blastococcus aggregatus]